jgi:hypothetical protein
MCIAFGGSPTASCMVAAAPFPGCSSGCGRSWESARDGDCLTTSCVVKGHACLQTALHATFIQCREICCRKDGADLEQAGSPTLAATPPLTTLAHVGGGEAREMGWRGEGFDG